MYCDKSFTNIDLVRGGTCPDIESGVLFILQCAYWFITINTNAECYNSVADILNSLSIDNKDFKYSYIYHYIAEQDDTFNANHIHLVLYFGRKPKRFVTLFNLFKGAHIEYTNRNRYMRCIQYLVHKNDKEKTQYSVSDIISNYSIDELSLIIDSKGYEFDLFDSSKIDDYILECLNLYGIDSSINIYLIWFIKKFGLDQIKPYYFIIKDFISIYLEK